MCALFLLTFIVMWYILFLGDYMNGLEYRILNITENEYNILKENLYCEHNNIDTECDIKENILRFKPDLHCDSDEYKEIYKDLLGLKYIGSVTYLDEYFLFDFPNRTFEERKEFVGTDEYLSAAKKLKNEIIQENPTLKDKYTAYLTLKPYYDRDAVLLKDFGDYNTFKEFSDNHPIFLLKKLTGSLGKNIKKIDLTDKNITAKRVFIESISLGQWIAEEIIKQSESMAIFHPASVNTVRITTYVNNGKITKLFAMFRMGSGDNVVDNASNGGICASVDLESGIIESNGYKKSGEIIEIHPDSGIKIKGFQIPRWNELLQLVDEVATKVEHYNYIGWDFALTDNGWVIVEGNSRPNINSIQMCSGRGLRKILENTIGI